MKLGAAHACHRETLRGCRGFDGYFLIEAGNGVMTSVSLFDTSAHADESTRLASTWVRDEKLESALPNAPKITFGEVIAQRKTNGAVRA